MESRRVESFERKSTNEIILLGYLIRPNGSFALGFFTPTYFALCEISVVLFY